MIEVEEGISFPTLEHVLWYLLGLEVKPTFTSSYLRNKIRSKKEFMEESIKLWDSSPSIRKKFMTLWKEQIMKDKVYVKQFTSHTELEKMPNYYCIIPKNKGTLYKEWGWNPEMIEHCGNRLGILFHTLVSSLMVQKSSTKEIKVEDEEEMMRDTFCPDCESLLFIRQLTKPDATEDTKEILGKYCQVCGWQNEMKEDDMEKPVYESSRKKEQLQLTDHDIEEVLLDPTLPRINNIPCVNPVCATNHLVDDEYGFIITSMADSELRKKISAQDRAETIGTSGLILFADTEDALRKRIADVGLKVEDGVIEKGPVHRNILYYRTNPDDLTYSYVCSTCKTIWSNN